MKPLLYLEDDFVARLLRSQFDGGPTPCLTKPGTLERAIRTEEKIDLLVIQSENVEHLTDVLELVERDARRIPTLVLTSKIDRLREEFQAFAHFISLQQVLESNFRWHVRLAITKRRLEELRSKLNDAESVLILLQDDPDPDAIASGLALRYVLGRNKLTAPIGSFGKVSRPENIAMVNILEIEIEKITRSNFATYDRVAIVDAQPPHLRHRLRDVNLVIDHHPEQFSYHADLRDIRPGYGATATIMLEYLRCADVTPSERLATAMLYGIKSDTFLLAREVNEWDVEAFSYLYPLANQNLMRRIERPALPAAAVDALGRALKTRRVIDKVAFVHLGRVEREDLIPQMADFCLQFEGVEWSAVSGIYDSSFVISVRNVGYVRAAGKAVKEAFGDVGSAGGHASMAKAVLPLSELSRKWNVDVRNTRLLNRRVETEFLKSIHTK